MALTRIKNAALDPSTGITADQLDVGQLGGLRNLIINGAMQVAQRGTSFTSGAAIYTLDRWKSQARAGASVTTSKEADQIVDGRSFGILKYNVTTPASDGRTVINHYVENGSQNLYGQTVTLSWYARVTSGSATITPVYELNAETSKTGSVETLTGSWQRSTWTVTLDGYTYPATTYPHLRILFYIEDSAAHAIEFTGVQLEVGDTATTFEHRSYGQELALCQRYYFIKSYPSDRHLGNGRWEGSSVSGTVFFPQTMRTSPTVTADTTGMRAVNPAVAWYSINNLNQVHKTGTQSLEMFFSASASGDHKGTSVIDFDTGGFVAFDAEL